MVAGIASCRRVWAYVSLGLELSSDLFSSCSAVCITVSAFMRQPGPGSGSHAVGTHAGCWVPEMCECVGDSCRRLSCCKQDLCTRMLLSAWYQFSSPQVSEVWNSWILTHHQGIKSAHLFPTQLLPRLWIQDKLNSCVCNYYPQSCDSSSE